MGVFLLIVYLVPFMIFNVFVIVVMSLMVATARATDHRILMSSIWCVCVCVRVCGK